MNPWRVLLRALEDVSATRIVVERTYLTVSGMRYLMSRQSDALADLDAQLDELVAYVNNDDQTDAAEVQARADRIKAVLAQVKAAPAPEPETPAEPAPGDVA